MDYLCSRNSVVALPVVLNLGLCVPGKGSAIDLHPKPRAVCALQGLSY